MPLVQVSGLVKPATYQPEVVCLFFQSLLALCVWGQFQTSSQGRELTEIQLTLYSGIIWTLHLTL